MYFEVYKKGNLIKRGKEALEPLSFDTELMYTPTCNLVLSIDWLECFDGREEVKIFINDKCFWGIVWDLEVDKIEEKITVSLRHVISEWEYRQISVNHAVSDENLNVVYKGDETAKSKDNDETITAKAFTVSLSQGKKLTNAQIIDKAFASAWKTSNGEKVSVTGVKKELKETEDGKDKYTTVSSLDKEGTYRITFSTAKGTSVAIEVRVEKKYEPDYNSSIDASIVDKLEDIYNDENFTYPGWYVEIQDGASEMIDYVYSKQNRLEALTQTMELTEDLFWRVGWWNEKRVQIGRFGKKRPYTVSLKPSGSTNIHILSEPVIDYDFENVINVATVYSDKSDSGMSSLTLREVYNDTSLQNPNFPVVILRAGVNNERDYTRYNAPDQPKKIAPNNELEFAVVDVASIGLEQGTIIEGSFAFNDLLPFEIEGKISDGKRVKASKAVYQSAIRKLIQARRSYDLSVVVEEIPADLLPGDKVRFMYDNRIWTIGSCSSYWKKILSYDDYFYVSHINYDIDSTGAEVNTLTLTKWIKIERETDNQ